MEKTLDKLLNPCYNKDAIKERKKEINKMNEIFGYCGWDFGGARNNEFQRGEHVRIGRNIYRVVFRIGSWHLLKRISEKA